MATFGVQSLFYQPSLHLREILHNHTFEFLELLDSLLSHWPISIVSPVFLIIGLLYSRRVVCWRHSSCTSPVLGAGILFDKPWNMLAE